jgi:hypothetical protein
MKMKKALSITTAGICFVKVVNENKIKKFCRTSKYGKLLFISMI